MNIELALVSKILETKDIRTPLKNKITPKFFYGEGKSIYEFITDYYGEYNEVPTLAVVNRFFPSFQIEEREEPIQFFCDELRKRQRYNMLVEGVNHITDLLEKGDIDTAMTDWNKIGTQVVVDTKVTRDLDLTSDVEQRIKAYQYMKANLGMIGIPFPWEGLNEATGGILSEDLITIAGFQAVGKTWILLKILHTAWVSGRKVVLFTREMAPEQMQRRLDALHFNLPYSDFRKGRLGVQLEEKYFSKIHELKDMPQFIISSDEEEGSGLSAIKAKLEEYQPDLFAIDGLYLVTDERGGKDWRAIVNLTQDTKKICRNLQIPGIVTTQAGVDSQGKDGIKLTSISFSKLAFGADSDIVIGIDSIEENTKWRLKLLKHREGEPFSLIVDKDFNTMRFPQFGEADYTEEEEEENEHDVIIY